MAIAFDSSASGGSSWSHTCNGSNRILFVTTTSDSSGGVTGVTYNGVSMTLEFGGGYHKIWKLINPASGANTVSITHSGSAQGVSSSYTGVSSTGNPEASASKNSGSSVTTITHSVTTITDNDWVVASCWYDTSSASQTAGTGSTQRSVRSGSASYASVGLYDNGSAKTPAGSVSMTVNASASSGIMEICLFALKPSVLDYPISLSYGAFTFTGQGASVIKGFHYTVSLAHRTFSYTGYILSFIIDLYIRVVNKTRNSVSVVNKTRSVNATVTNKTRNSVSVVNKNRN